MGTGGPFPGGGGKARPGRKADHSPHLMPRSRMSSSHTPLPLSACMASSRTALSSCGTNAEYNGKDVFWQGCQHTSLFTTRIKKYLQNNVVYVSCSVLSRNLTGYSACYCLLCSWSLLKTHDNFYRYVIRKNK
jgi:hypothetical protein